MEINIILICEDSVVKGHTYTKTLALNNGKKNLTVYIYKNKKFANDVL